MDSRKIKKFVLNNLAYVIFGYAGNIICFAFRTAEGKDVSEKLLPALNNLGTAFAHIIPSFHPVDLLVGIAVGVAMKFVMKMRAANKKKFRQGTEYGSAVRESFCEYFSFPILCYCPKVSPLNLI